MRETFTTITHDGTLTLYASLDSYVYRIILFCSRMKSLLFSVWFAIFNVMIMKFKIRKSVSRFLLL